MDNDLPSEVRDFIAQNIVSLEQIEVLLWLFRCRDRDWSASEINAQLRSQESSIAKWLRLLVALHLAREVDGRYQFFPATAELDENTALLSLNYRMRSVRIIQLIYAKPNANLTSFAKAFEFKRRP